MVSSADFKFCTKSEDLVRSKSKQRLSSFVILYLQYVVSHLKTVFPAANPRISFFVPRRKNLVETALAGRPHFRNHPRLLGRVLHAAVLQRVRVLQEALRIALAEFLGHAQHELEFLENAIAQVVLQLLSLRSDEPEHVRVGVARNGWLGRALCALD